MIVGIFVIGAMALAVGVLVTYVIVNEDPSGLQRREEDEEQERFIAEWCEKHKDRKEPLWRRIIGGKKK